MANDLKLQKKIAGEPLRQPAGKEREFFLFSPSISHAPLPVNDKLWSKDRDIMKP
jgi:hypothetical protein